MICGSSYIEIVFILLTKGIVLHVQAFIIKIGVLGFKKMIVEYGTYLKLAIVLILNK